MDTLKAIEERRSVKSFDPDYVISQEEVNTIIEKAMLSPTAFNCQNWRFVLVEDKELRDKIKEAAWGQAQVTDASLLFVLCADLKAWDKDPVRYWRNAPKEVQEFMVPTMSSYYKDKNEVQRDEAMRSCGIAAQTLMLTAKALGYDSCPMDGFDYDQVGKLINLPEDHIISMFVVIGKALAPARARGGQLAKEEVLIKNSFS